MALCGNTRERAVLRRKVTHIVNHGSLEETGDGANPRKLAETTQATCTAATTCGISA